MISFERIALEDAAHEREDCVGHLNVFQTAAWLRLMAQVQRAEPVRAAVASDGRFVGYFYALLFRKHGLKILGSPFRGALAYFMGFNLRPNAPRHEILEALPDFAFEALGCHHLELIDPNLSAPDWSGLAYRAEDIHYYGLDLTKSEDQLLAGMDSTGRNCIRKSIKNGVVIEEARDPGFADDYYAQYQQVLARRSLSPAYSLETVRELVNSLLPTGNLLLLRALDSAGLCIATGIFIALNKAAVFWGAASWHQYQPLRPNEPLAWYGIRQMKARGIEVLHFGGKAEHYKEKLGCEELHLHRLTRTRYHSLDVVIRSMMSPQNERYRNWALRQLNR